MCAPISLGGGWLFYGPGGFLFIWQSPVGRHSTSIKMPQQSAAGAGHGHGNAASSAKIVNGASDQGDANTQASLGDRYWYGVDGFAQDDAKAAALYQQAADQGHAGGKFGLGYCYLGGHGVDPDETKRPRANYG